MPGKRHHVFLSLGSNLDNREIHLRQGLIFIEEEIGKVIRQSSVYESEPWMMYHTGWFLNQIVEVLSDLYPEEILTRIGRYELSQGRKRIPGTYTPRNIDIDILFMDDLVIHSDILEIPHPKIPERNFILFPLEEIAGQFVHPLEQITITELRQRCKDHSRLHIFSTKETP